MKARRTPPAYYVAAILAGIALGAIFFLVTDRLPFNLLSAPALVCVILICVAAYVLYMARQVRRYVKGELKKLDDRTAVNALMLSKALALSSALLVGFYGGEAIMCAMRSLNEYYSGQILSCLTVAIVCIVDMFAGILGEKWCQLPSDDIKDEKSSDRAGNASNASNASNAAESSVEKNKA